jgi:hypothetical protein
MKMKLLNLRNILIFLMAGLMLSACKKQDEDTPLDFIAGTWTTGTHNITVMVGTKTLKQYYVDVLGLAENDAQFGSNMVTLTFQQYMTGTIQVNPDGTYSSTLGGETITGTWSLSYDWKKLIMDSEAYDILELTSNKLRFKMTQYGSQDFDEDGTAETVTINIEMVLIK